MTRIKIEVVIVLECKKRDVTIHEDYGALLDIVATVLPDKFELQ